WDDRALRLESAEQVADAVLGRSLQRRNGHHQRAVPDRARRSAPMPVRDGAERRHQLRRRHAGRGARRGREVRELHALSRRAAAFSEHARRRHLDRKRQAEVRRRRLRAVPYAVVHHEQVDRRGAQRKAGEPVLRPPGARHGRRTGRRREPGRGWPEGIPHRAAVGSRPADLLPARRAHLGPRARHPRAFEQRLRSKRRHQQLQQPRRAQEVEDVLLGSLAEVVEAVDDAVCFGAVANGVINSFNNLGERTKQDILNFLRSPRLLKLLMTPFASEPLLECSRMARSRSEVRPSCRKKIRWPRPHSGAVRNSLGPASPWLTPSASPSPMSCTRRSENRFTGFSLSAATVDLLVVNDGVWHSAQPTSANFCLPFAIEVALPGVFGEGCGASRKRMKFANLSTPPSTSTGVAASKLVTSFGTVANWHWGASSRSVWNSSLVMPISTL